MSRRYRLTAASLFLVIALLVSLGGVAGAASVKVRPASMEAAAGSTVELPIQITGAPGIGAMQMELVFDPAMLAPETVKRGPLLSNGLLEFNKDKSGRVKIAMATLDAINGDGAIAIVGFKVLGAKGQKSNLKLENSLAWEGSTHLNIAVYVEPGQVLIKGKGGFPWWIILIVVLVILLAGLTWLLMARRRPKTA